MKLFDMFETYDGTLFKRFDEICPSLPQCGNEGHIFKMFAVAGKRVQERGICATSFLNNHGISALFHLKVTDMVATAIVDAGCSKTILN